MDVLKREGGLLHRGHVLRVEARGLERVDLHLELEAGVLQPLELLLRDLLPSQCCSCSCSARSIRSDGTSSYVLGATVRREGMNIDMDRTISL